MTFGSFNNLTKITDRALRTWASILEAVSGSRLLVKGRGLTQGGAQTGLGRRFEAAGIAAGRWEIMPPHERVEDHFAATRFVPRMLEDAQGKLNLERTPTRRPADDGFEDVERAEERPVHDGREDWGVMPREQRGRKRAKGRRKEPIGFHGHGTTLKPPRRR